MPRREGAAVHYTSCRHCSLRVGCAGRGLCLPCWRDLAVRSRYPAHQHAARRWYVVAVRPDDSTYVLKTRSTRALAERLARRFRAHLQGVRLVRVEEHHRKDNR